MLSVQRLGTSSMCHLLRTILVFITLAGVLRGQEAVYRVAARMHGNQGQVGTCDQRPVGQCQPPAAVPPQAPPQQQPPAAPPGYYAAPPQSGAYAGPSNSVGLEGLAIHFPAMSLKLPTIQFPNFFAIRSNPRMFVEAAQAPYVQQMPVVQGAPIAVQSVPMSFPPQTPQQQPPVQQPPPPLGAPA